MTWHHVLAQLPQHMNSWLEGQTTGVLLEEQATLCEPTLGKGMIPISIWKYSQVWGVHTDMGDFGSSSLIHFKLFANKHK